MLGINAAICGARVRYMTFTHYEPTVRISLESISTSIFHVNGWMLDRSVQMVSNLPERKSTLWNDSYAIRNAC
ncbi:hypothetical protein MUK70_10445 [Dyadobacter chenwenxiniae]|uniref:Uncharacterized protein n=1 Tax=Dyadobacter chenwenxiniae TaxID=2906456 RepID=A0A9X1PQT1_9BACT|nr:hypothetical protein [Dyadobacter chenwenxiniae]MCF0063216.1 hypothetical protein [Dyadobacter chenwenxiniae]UON85404.1 hypothetical protein MUK70_10445 [Dyadobacter chenwenxiniae]